MIAACVTIFVLILGLIYFLKTWIKTVIIALKLPGPVPKSIFGTLRGLDTDGIIAIERRAQKEFGPVFPIWIFVVPVMVTFDPKIIQIILGSSKHTDKSFFYTFMHTFIGEGLITNNGMKWKFHRKVIQPYFRKSVLDQFVVSFYNNSKNIVNKLKGEKKVNVVSYVNDNVFNILYESVLGVSETDLLEHEELQDSPFRKGSLLLLFRLVRPWYLLNSFYNNSKLAQNELTQKQNLQSYVRKVLDLRRQGHIKGGKCKSLMEMFIEISNKSPEFTDEDIINEICTFMLAGQDSVGSATAFALYYLAKHEDVQKIAREEVDRVLGNEEVDSNDLDELKYLEQCAKEALRLCPSVPVISRSLSEDVQIGDHIYPKGTVFLICIYGTHRLQEIYPDPEKYDPDRFSPENEQKLSQFSYLPFSAGPRNCIGNKYALMEMKTLLALMLKNYELSIPDEYGLQFNYRVTLRAHGGIWLNLKSRTAQQ